MGNTITQHIESELDSNELTSPLINSPFDVYKSNPNSATTPTSLFSFSKLISNPITSFTPTPISPAGLSILLTLETNSFNEAKNIVFSTNPRINNVVPISGTPEIFSIPPSPLMYGPLSAQDIMLHEEYTCVRVHGPNPRVIHIFGDCILTSHPFDCVPIRTNPQPASNPHLGLTIGSFLKNCNMCKKVHMNENHIHLYRDMSFCSLECREYEMWLDRHDKMMRRAKKPLKRVSRDSTTCTGATSTSKESIFFIGD